MDRLELIGSLMLILLIIMALYSDEEPKNNFLLDHIHMYKHNHFDDYNDHIYENFNITQNTNQTISITGNNTKIKNINQNCSIKINNNKVFINNNEITNQYFFDFEYNNILYKIAKVVTKNCKVFIIQFNDNIVKVFSSQ
tara:strand:- start:147 stop:566 length:420 start_codon:yes stop_codon:yes gene_type:complete